jgi:hypothetical protein
MDKHEKRELLRMLIDKIVFYGDKAEVFGMLPINSDPQHHKQSLSEYGDLATLDSQNQGRNVPFRITIPIVRKTRTHRFRSIAEG